MTTTPSLAPARPALGDCCPACGAPLDVRTLELPMGLGPSTYVLECPCEIARRDAAAHHAQAEAAAARRHARLARCGIPARYAAATLAAADATAPGRTAILAACRAFVTAGVAAGRGLTLLGAPGTGKTYLAAAVTRALIERDVDAVLVSVPQLLLLGRSRAPEAATAFDDALDRARGCAHLWLDDVGRERPTEWAREVLALVLDGRYAAGRATSLASHLAPSLLHARLGETLARRVVETTTLHWCPGLARPVTGPSRSPDDRRPSPARPTPTLAISPEVR